MSNKRIFYTAAVGMGLFAGAAGVANAATGRSTAKVVVAASQSADTTATTTAAASASSEANDANESNDANNTNDEGKGHDGGLPTGVTSSITTPVATAEPDDATEAKALAALAKVTSDQASAAATAAVPGTVRKVELENANGNVVYKVEVTGANGTSTDVIIDAGNGKVLAQEADDHHGGKNDHGTESNDGPDSNDSTTVTTAAK